MLIRISSYLLFLFLSFSLFFTACVSKKNLNSGKIRTFKRNKAPSEKLEGIFNKKNNDNFSLYKRSSSLKFIFPIPACTIPALSFLYCTCPDLAF